MGSLLLSWLFSWLLSSPDILGTAGPLAPGSSLSARAPTPNSLSLFVTALNSFSELASDACCPGARRGCRPAAHGGAGGAGVCGNSDPARLSASRGQTPTNPPRRTNSAGRARGPPGGHPSRAADPFLPRSRKMVPERSDRSAACGERGERGAGALLERRQDKENHVRRRRCGAAAAPPGAGRCGAVRPRHLLPPCAAPAAAAARPFLRGAF